MRGPDVEAYCLRCECKYEERSSVTIKVKEKICSASGIILDGIKIRKNIGHLNSILVT